MTCYLGEREVGFDPTMLGFPSISNCQAIVFVTANGLYGLHAFGGNSPTSLAHYAARFNDFVRGPVPNRAGTRLYGVTFARGNRYVAGGGNNWEADWTAELTTYAQALNYGGKIRGYDLTRSIANPPDSAYVEFRKAGDKCEIHVKRWSDGDRKLGTNPSSLTHRRTHPNQAQLLDITSNVVTDVTTTGLMRVHSQRLRG